MKFFSLFIAILPIVLIGLYIYKKDKIKESFKLLLKLFLGGVLSCVPAIVLGVMLSFFIPFTDNLNAFQLFLYVFIVVAFSEELCKWLILYKISYNNSEFDSLYDMVVYAAFVALGFACIENIIYVSNEGIIAGFLRAITAVPGHVCDGILMGSYLSLAKINQINGNYKLSKKYKIFSFIFPIITHGIYDYCLFLGNLIFIMIFIVFVICLFIICLNKVKKISSNNIKFGYNNFYYANVDKKDN